MTETAQHTALPWVASEGGDFEHESYIEKFWVITPATTAPKTDMEDVENEIARVGVALWRYRVRHRNMSEAEDQANAKLIVRCVNSHDALLEALQAIAGGPGPFGLPVGRSGEFVTIAVKKSEIAAAQAAIAACEETQP